VLEQDSVLKRLMPALEFALGLRVIGGAADVLHFLLIQPFREILGEVLRRRGCQRIEAAAGSPTSSSRTKKISILLRPSARGAALVVGDRLRLALASLQRAKGKGSKR